MLQQKYGRIVNVASIAGKEGNPNASAYSAAKAGVIALTKSLGKELAGQNIAVNCITPAAARTRIFEQISQEHIDYMLSKIPRGRFLERRRNRGHGGVAGVGRELFHHRGGIRSERRTRDLLAVHGAGRKNHKPRRTRSITKASNAGFSLVNLGVLRGSCFSGSH